MSQLSNSGGIEKFDKAHNEGIIEKLYTTNLTFIENEVKEKSWCRVVDCSVLLARIINNLSKHEPLREIYDEKPKILLKK